MEISVYVQNFKNQFRNTQESFVIAAKTYYEALKEHGEEAERAFHSQFKLTKKTWVLLEQVGRGIIPVELVFHAKFPYAKYAVKLSPQKCKQLLEVGYVDYTIGVHDHRQVRLPPPLRRATDYTENIKITYKDPHRSEPVVIQAVFEMKI